MCVFACVNVYTLLPVSLNRTPPPGWWTATPPYRHSTAPPSIQFVKCLLNRRVGARVPLYIVHVGGGVGGGGVVGSR